MTKAQADAVILPNFGAKTQNIILTATKTSNLTKLKLLSKTGHLIDRLHCLMPFAVRLIEASVTIRDKHPRSLKVNRFV
jgi:hypothetical protein